jgi:hypothetical protein
MAVFSAIAGAIVGALTSATFITTLFGQVVVGIVAGGLAYGTAKTLGVFKPPSMDQGADPGVSVQLPPATDNKLPVLYGQAFTSGPIFDAAISNENKTMTYCIALSEETTTGTFSCSEIFMNDAKLIFSGNTVTSHVDPNQSTATSYAGNVRVNIYQGGSAGSDVIFPANGTGASTAATSIVPHWGVNHTANAMVFAVLQIDYDAENGLAGLPQMTFKMNNTLNNPGDVLFDYLTNDRYGAGLANAQIDITSITGTANTAMKGYSDELVSYTNASNVSTTLKRYQINGMLSTFDTCSTNIDKICQSAGTFFSFNVKDGKFKTIPNRALSTAEKTNCLVYNDDNIVSKIDISSTELYSLYNGVEVEFMDKQRKDQTNTVKITTPPADRNANEPDNVLNYKLDMINDNIRAEILGNIDLNQSRYATVVQFVSDFSGIQSDVGDVIKVTNDLYGWTDKLFRVLRVVEQQTPEGMVTAQITAMEYTDDYYVHPVLTETPDIGFIDLPRLPIIPPIYIPEVYAGDYTNVAALPGSVFGNVIVNDAMKTFGAGTQLTDQPASNTSVVSGTTFNEIIPEESYDITGIDIGDYEFTSSAGLGGAPTTAFDVGFTNKVTLTWANSTASVSNVITGGGVQYSNVPVTTALGNLTGTLKIPTDPTLFGHPADMKPQTANVSLLGYSDITEDTANGFPRTFAGLNYQMLRVTKGERE